MQPELGNTLKIEEHLAKSEESHITFWFTVVTLFLCILLALSYINGMNIYDQDRFIPEAQRPASS